MVGRGSRTTSPGADGQLIAWRAKNQWPTEYRRSPVTIQAVCQDTIRYADVLRWMPCYRGCEEDGHSSVVDCFVDEFRTDGSVVLDSMGFG